MRTPKKNLLPHEFYHLKGDQVPFTIKITSSVVASQGPTTSRFIIAKPTFKRARLREGTPNEHILRTQLLHQTRPLLPRHTRSEQHLRFLLDSNRVFHALTSSTPTTSSNVLSLVSAMCTLGAATSLELAARSNRLYTITAMKNHFTVNCTSPNNCSVVGNGTAHGSARKFEAHV